MQDLLSCKKCPRIVNNLDKLRKIYPNYLNRPIIPIKRNKSSIAIVGLAPGLTGANRTGHIFNGDFSGDILNKAIKLSGINLENKLLSAILFYMFINIIFTILLTNLYHGLCHLV